MNTVNKLAMVFVIGAAAVAGVFGQQTGSDGANLKKLITTSGRSSTTSAIKSEYINSYYLGYDLESAKEHIRKKDTREALAQLAFLWDELYLQTEVPQVEAVMRMLVRGQGTPEFMISKLDAVKTSIEARLRIDHKWYYNVGKGYSQMTIAINDEDISGFKTKLGELGILGRTSPAGTPSEFVSALAKLGDYSGKSTLSDGDIAVIKAQWETIDSMIAA